MSELHGEMNILTIRWVKYALEWCSIRVVTIWGCRGIIACCVHLNIEAIKGFNDFNCIACLKCEVVVNLKWSSQHRCGCDVKLFDNCSYDFISYSGNHGFTTINILVGRVEVLTCVDRRYPAQVRLSKGVKSWYWLCGDTISQTYIYYLTFLKWCIRR